MVPKMYLVSALIFRIYPQKKANTGSKCKFFFARQKGKTFIEDKIIHKVNILLLLLLLLCLLRAIITKGLKMFYTNTLLM